MTPHHLLRLGPSSNNGRGGGSEKGRGGSGGGLHPLVLASRALLLFLKAVSTLADLDTLGTQLAGHRLLRLARLPLLLRQHPTQQHGGPLLSQK
jgi:hypothetical protein